MKTIGTILFLMLLAGPVSVRAQSNGNPPDRRPTPTAEGVPESKAKKQPRRGSDKPIPPSSLGTESDASATAKGKISPGSHGAHRDPRADFKASKPKSKSTGKQ